MIYLRPVSAFVRWYVILAPQIDYLVCFVYKVLQTLSCCKLILTEFSHRKPYSVKKKKKKLGKTIKQRNGIEKKWQPFFCCGFPFRFYLFWSYVYTINRRKNYWSNCHTVPCKSTCLGKLYNLNQTLNLNKKNCKITKFIICTEIIL